MRSFWICGAVTTLILAQVVQCQQQFSLPEAEADDDEALDEEGIDLSPSPASIQYRLRPYDYSDEVEDQQQPIHQTITQAPQLIYTAQQQRRTSTQPNPHPHPPAQKVYKKLDKTKQQLLQEELDNEEPDRLSLLLEKSSFKCNGRLTGYYADETLGCEVFHYCQDNSRHSWICPEGFTFHQVHLICMPASADNICEQSTKYHFVNEYLYKPINMEEHQTRPNVTLRYSERYYPDEIYQDERQEYYNERVFPERHQDVPQQQIHYTRQPVQTVRKVTVPTPQPYRPPSSTPHNTVFRSPEEINISLQQRRPQQHIFQAQATSTTPRYDEDDDEEEYSYERKK
ncbi:uncharacterized protein LOC132259894 isoform X2 [Phlebotomus argentipes]|uniref:uncharacterized protein LOC132259894 isoform X2 n=1 Tax=Phlebotomus argentipes TaxID=94469 RepID=UPI002892E440|nr:uncharacterized protein LOC132259894 isoform X2 [Phlebotomus argentipes]